MVRTMVATHGWARPGDPSEQVGHEVGAASLPAGSAEDCGDGASEPPDERPIQPVPPRRGYLADSERRKASQKAPSSLVPTSIPMISRLPSPLTAVATTTLTLTILPASLTFWVSASSHR